MVERDEIGDLVYGAHSERMSRLLSRSSPRVCLWKTNRNSAKNANGNSIGAAWPRECQIRITRLRCWLGSRTRS